MSEEKITVEAFLEEASDMKNKIKELEKTQTEMKLAHDTWWVDLGNSIKEKIPELEQKLLTFEALYTDIDHKRLGALEKKYEHQCENCQILMADRVHEIAELKEHFKIDVTHLTKFGNRILRVACDNKARLREFFKKMLHYSQIAEFPSDQAHTNLRSFYETQLKKLDGNWNPTLGDGIPEDARFPATDSKPSLAGSARQTERKCETCRYRAVVCEDWVDECDDHNKWEPIKIFQAEEREDVDRQTVFCPICGNEITKIEHVVFHDFKVIVAREDLERWIRLIGHMNSDNTEDYIASISELMKGIEKYLKEEEDDP